MVAKRGRWREKAERATAAREEGGEATTIGGVERE